MAQLIRAYGAAAVTGRVMGLGELRRMRAAENVVNAHASRRAAESWAKWTKDNPGLSRLLAAAERYRDG